MEKRDAKLKCGVVGVGYLGRHHARIYSELDSTELVGVMDNNREKAEEIAAQYGCRVFDSLDELGDACEAVSVVVPTDLHAQVAMPLLDKGCDLLIEKPICTSVEDAEKIARKAKEKGLIVQVGHIEHFNPVMAFMEEHVNAPRFITADRLAPFNPRGTEVGVVLDLMIHDIGVVLKLANSPVVRVEAVGVDVISPREDIANARLQFENGCVANLNVSRVSMKKLREIRIFQPGTYMSLDFMNQKGHLVKVNRAEVMSQSEITSVEVPIEKAEPLKVELASFAKCVVDKLNPKVGALLGLHALEIALEITSQINKFRALNEGVGA